MTAARRTSSLLALIGAGALLLAGCASGAAVPASSGSASETPIGGEIRTEAGWLDGGRFIGIVTDGSSTCVPTATDATVQADGTLAVTLDNGPADKACTADMVPRVSVVGVPEGVDPTKDLDIEPSAGWTEDSVVIGESELSEVPSLDLDEEEGEW